jgi:hypothetical protein
MISQSTDWLQLVWDALAEDDADQRDAMLAEANNLLAQSSPPNSDQCSPA